MSVLLLAGFAASAHAPAKFAPKPDGRYDNHTYLVDSSRMNLSRVGTSIVTLQTKTTFEGPNGELIERELKGSGVVLAGRFVLTVEHSVTQHNLKTQTPFGTVELPAKKTSEETFIRWRGGSHPLRVIYKNRTEDIALFELPPDVRPPSFPYPLGNSDELQVGNFVYVVGNPLNLGINVREGIVSALRAPEQVSRVEAKGENAFMVSNGLVPGDSGTPIVAIRDGRFELVGISQGTFFGTTRLGWVIRINVIRDSLRTAKALAEEKWTALPRPVPAPAQGTNRMGAENLLTWLAVGLTGPGQPTPHNP